MPPGRGSAVGRKFLAPPYYSQRAVFASPPSAFFITHELIASARGLCFHRHQFVSQQDYAKTTHAVFTKFSGKLARGPWKKPLDCADNPDHVMLGLGLG